MILYETVHGHLRGLRLAKKQAAVLELKKMKVFMSPRMKRFPNPGWILKPLKQQVWVLCKEKRKDK